MTVRFTVDGLPPSDNNAYTNVPRRGRVPTAKALAWKRDVQGAMVSQTSLRDRRALGQSGAYAVELTFHLGVFGQETGSVKKWDVSSHQKLTVDAIADMLGVDDRYVAELCVRKVDLWHGAPRVEVALRPASFLDPVTQAAELVGGDGG